MLCVHPDDEHPVVTERCNEALTLVPRPRVGVIRPRRHLHVDEDVAGWVPPPERAVAYVDGYGNIKTTWTSAPAQMGDLVQITTGSATAVAVVTEGTFAVRQGEMSFAPGSSGWATAGGHHAFYEVLLRGGSASERLGSPGAGAPVDVRPL